MASSNRASRIADRLLQLGAFHLRKKPFHHLGFRSPLYVDTRLLFGDVQGRKWAVDALAEAAKASEPDFVVGIETAGIGWGALVAAAISRPFGYIRIKPKSYGTLRRVEGTMPAGSRLLLVDDVLFSGTTAFSCREYLLKKRCRVSGLAVLLNYQLKRTTKPGFQVDEALSIEHVLDAAIGQGRLDEDSLAAIRHFLDSPETWAPRV